MEKEADLKLLHPRSMAAVISDGYRLYMGSFKKLFRSSWIVAIVYAIAFALMMGNMVNNVVPMMATIQAFGADAVTADSGLTSASLKAAGAAILFLLAAMLLAAQGFRAFQEHQQTNAISRPKHWYGQLCLKQFIKMLPVALWLFVITAVVSALFVAVVYGILSLGVVSNVWKSIASMCLMALLAIIIIALLVPLEYTVMKAMMAPKLSFLPPVKGYVSGLRHWGLLFATLFVVYIMTELLTMICELPAVIMTVANAEAYSGLALGDPLGMPENIVPLTYAIFTLAGFIQAYVHLSTLFPVYYAYGSVEQQESERMNMRP